MVRPRTRQGERRIDAAIDYLADFGFPKPQITRVINDLLKVYGRDGWVFLEEGQYRIVLEKLLEEPAQPQQDQVLQENDVQVLPGNHKQVSGVQNVAQKSQSALEPQASHNSSPSLEHVLPVPPAGQAAPERPVRPPCHGWISEESDTESEPEDGEVHSEIPIPRERSPLKRRRPSRWDVGPN